MHTSGLPNLYTDPAEAVESRSAAHYFGPVDRGVWHTCCTCCTHRVRGAGHGHLHAPVGLAHRHVGRGPWFGYADGDGAGGVQFAELDRNAAVLYQPDARAAPYHPAADGPVTDRCDDAGFRHCVTRLVGSIILAPAGLRTVGTFVFSQFEQGSVQIGMAMSLIAITITSGILLVVNLWLARQGSSAFS